MTDTKKQNKYEHEKCTPDKSTDIAAAAEFFVKYQLPWINSDNNSKNPEDKLLTIY
jgi:hypothetical protein